MLEKYCRRTTAAKTMVLIYGPPLTGKTTGSLTFPNWVVVDIDHNLAEGLDRVVPLWDDQFVDGVIPRKIHSVANRTQALAIILADLVRDMPEDSTIVIDSLTRLESWYNTQEEKEPKPLSKRGEQDGFEMFARRLSYFTTILTICTAARANIVFTVHQQQERNDKGEVTGHIKPSLMGQIGEKLPGYFPVVLQAVRKEDPAKKGEVQFFWRIRPSIYEPARVPKPVTFDFIPQQYSELKKYL